MWDLAFSASLLPALRRAPRLQVAQPVQVLLPSGFAVARRPGFVTCTLSFAAVVAPAAAAAGAAALSCELPGTGTGRLQRNSLTNVESTNAPTGKARSKKLKTTDLLSCHSIHVDEVQHLPKIPARYQPISKSSVQFVLQTQFLCWGQRLHGSLKGLYTFCLDNSSTFIV